MKKIILIVAFFVFFSFNELFSSPHPYTILIKPEINSGWNKPMQIINIPVLKKGEYSQRSFYIKTKKYELLDKFSKSFLNSNIQKIIGNLNIEQISHPFGERADMRLSESNPGLDRIYLVTVTDSLEPYEICEKLSALADVVYACPVFFKKLAAYTPNDVDYPRQYALKMIDAAKAWDVVKGDSSIIIGIIDSGVDYGHYDLLGAVHKNTKEIPGDGIDNDGNGYIDDVYGWDFVGNITPSEAAKGNFKPDNDVIPKNSSNSHGTHVAGLAASVTDNSIGIASAAFHASFIPVKTTIDDLSLTTGSADIYAGFAGIRYAVDMGAKIINLSWVGEAYDPVEQDIVAYAWLKGVLILAAAGNDALNSDYSPDFPSAYPGVVAVGAHDAGGNISSYSRFGYAVDFFAPGDTIFSTTPGNNYGKMSGTSMATPIAASVAALVMKQHPDWSQDQVRHQLRSTTLPMVIDSVFTPLIYGRINANRAVRYNNPAFPDSLVPGVGITGLQILNNSAITSYLPVKAGIILHNYLASAKNLTVSISSDESYFTLSSSQFFISELPYNTDYQIVFTLQLNRYNPWMVGYLPLKFKFTTSDGYVDYQLLNIPIDIDSKNQFSIQFQEPDSVSYFYRQCSSQGFSDFKAVGKNLINSGKRSFFDISAQNKYSLLIDDDIKSISCLADNVIVGSTGGKTYRKTGSGNFTETNISSITPDVRALNYFSPQRICMIGASTDEYFAIANSIDGGATWKFLPEKVFCESDEDVYYNSHSFLGDRGLFGTSKGRIISTSDSGKSWQSYTLAPEGAVRYTSPLPGGGAVCAYYETYASHLSLAYSKDGNSWTKTSFDLNALNISPSAIVPDKSRDFVYMISNTGRIYKYEPLKSKLTGVLSSEFFGETVTTGNLYQNSQKSRIWMAGDNVYALDFPPSAAKDTFSLVSLESSPYNFGDIVIDSTVYFTVHYVNKGNEPIIIDSVQFIIDPADSNIYTVDPTVPAILYPADTMKINFSVNGVVKGQVNKNILIWSDELNNTVRYDFKGNIINSIGVVDNSSTDKTIIYPNPADKSISVHYRENTVSIAINDITGKLLLEKKINGFSENEILIDISSLIPGVYLLESISKNGVNSVQKLIIER